MLAEGLTLGDTDADGLIEADGETEGETLALGDTEGETDADGLTDALGLMRRAGYYRGAVPADALLMRREIGPGTDSPSEKSPPPP